MMVRKMGRHNKNYPKSFISLLLIMSDKERSSSKMYKLCCK